MPTITIAGLRRQSARSCNVTRSVPILKTANTYGVEILSFTLQSARRCLFHFTVTLPT